METFCKSFEDHVNCRLDLYSEGQTSQYEQSPIKNMKINQSMSHVKISGVLKDEKSELYINELQDVKVTKLVAKLKRSERFNNCLNTSPQIIEKEIV